jgi:undecaprenyl-diphosphatase
MHFIEYLKAVFLGIVEGITEWLPISSTGHMILVDNFIELKVSKEFLELFLVVIQLGAIVAVPVIFWNKINPISKKKTPYERKQIWNLWGKVVVGVLPAAVLGFLLDDIFDEYFYNYVVVSIALVVYGILFIIIEKIKQNKEFKVNSVYDLSYKDALIIGSYQTLSLIPGTSRSGSTILGGMLTGVSRTASAEFSFFMAIPVMLGASLLKILKFLKEGFVATSDEIILLIVGMVVSFIVSIVAIKFLMNFVKKHSFSAFGVYRIILGALVIGYFLINTFVIA